jgi:sphingomyelin phosphodiesterase acid-like 3
MARRAGFFVSLAAVMLALALAGPIACAPPVRGAEGSGTFVVITDFHFNPFEPPELATSLASSAPAAWKATFVAARDQAMSRIGEDTNHALLAARKPWRARSSPS